MYPLDSHRRCLVGLLIAGALAWCAIAAPAQPILRVKSANNCSIALRSLGASAPSFIRVASLRSVR